MVDDALGHELRNLVMPILLRLDVLRATEPLSPKAQVEIGVIRDMVQQLERLAAGSDGVDALPASPDHRSHVTMLDTWWLELQPMVASALPPHAVVTTDFAHDLSPALVPPGVLAQVILGLLSDARDALQRLENPRVEIRARMQPLTLRLEVADNRPFDETDGHGTARGDALLRRYGARLSEEERPGERPIAVISLPVAPWDNVTASVPGVRVRLLMKDPRQLAVARMVLSQWGWRETSPSDAGRADLLLCDAEHFHSQSEQTAWLRSLEAAGCRVVVIGSGHGQPERANVHWLESRDLPTLGALLR